MSAGGGFSPLLYGDTVLYVDHDELRVAEVETVSAELTDGTPNPAQAIVSIKRKDGSRTQRRRAELVRIKR